MSCFPHGARKEARIEQVKDRVFDTTNILIDWQPVVGDLWICWFVFPWRRKAGEVPAGIDECIHGVCFTTCILAALRAGHMAPCRMAVQRVARNVKRYIVRQLDRQVLFRNRHDAADFAVNDWDRAAPITLA
ncbi:hypothetical protein D3C80_1664680 [compost metagenome]